MPLALAWESIDRHRGFTVLAVVGLIIAGALAVFGLPPVDLHGPLHRQFGITDPLCGGTRGVRYAMLGHWGLAWAYNPVSVPLVVGAIFFVLRHLVGRVSGHWLTLRVHRSRRLVIALVVVIVVLVVALEINQQLHAPLLLAEAPQSQ